MDYIINPEQSRWPELADRPSMDSEQLMSSIQSIFDEVKRNGDRALIELTQKFDHVLLTDLSCDSGEVNESNNNISEELKSAIDQASENIEKFHRSQVMKVDKVETIRGVECWQEQRPIENVGLYIPGGSAPLFSTVLMLAIPAKIAGCKNIILCTPPGKEGNIHPAILYAAKRAGVHKIFKVGGAQAVAAMCLGTESIPSVQKIFGPGNQYVTAAKQHALKYGCSIDMPAGPSEVLVITSENSNPEYVASDLLSQAEHGTDSQVICIGTNQQLLEKIEAEISKQLEQLPRKKIAEGALENSKLICFKSVSEALNFSNYYAPEHLIIADDDYEEYIGKIENAGSVFLGNYCPESAGDYASGTNHTLPTAGYAKMYSGVNIDSFTKKITFQHISKEGIRNIGKHIEVMAEAEGLFAHKNAVSLRMKG